MGLQESGYELIRAAIPHAAIGRLLENMLKLVAENGGHFHNAYSSEIADFFNIHKDVQSKIYDDIRRYPWLREFSSIPEITSHIPLKNFGLFEKIPFRIDTPFETSQLAVWHQDFFYVRGNTEVITAWIPMQDSSYLNGCLQVMPGSHKLGPLEHDVTVLGKRHYPKGIFDREIRNIEMRKGDILLMHACLLHSSGFNFSTTVRYSVQARYTPAGLPTDPGMGRVIPLTEAI